MSLPAIRLETERLVLRPPAAGDLPAFTAFLGSERSRFVGGPVPEGRAWRAFASIVGHWVLHGEGVFVMAGRDDDAALGGVGAWYPAGWPEREISYAIWSPGAEGRGLVSEALPAVLAHYRQARGWKTAVSYIDPRNARSVAVAERQGAAIDPEAAVPDNDAVCYRYPAEAA